VPPRALFQQGVRPVRPAAPRRLELLARQSVVGHEELPDFGDRKNRQFSTNSGIFY